MQQIVVAHGALGSAVQMQPLAVALVGLPNVAVTVVEFPGHGHTPIADDAQFRIEHFADALAEIVSALPGAPPLLFGYSMGGYVGLALEARSPGMFSGIVTLGTKFDWTPSGAELEASRLDPVVIREKVPKFAAALAERHVGAGGWEHVLARSAVMMRASGSAPLLSDRLLSQIGIPVCVAVGTQDDLVSVDESERAAALMPHGRCVSLDNVAHPIERVPTEVVVALIAAMRST